MNRPVSAKEISASSAVEAEWKLIRDFSAQDIAAWRELSVRALEPNVFLDSDFARAAAMMRGGDTGAVLVRDGSRLVGLFPGEVEGIAAGRAVSTFVAWTHPYAPLSTALLDRDMAGLAVEKFFDFLPSISGAPKLALFPFANESGEAAGVMAKAFAERAVVVKRFAVHERAAFSPQASDAPVLSAKKLKELRRQRRRLEEEGALKHETIVDRRGIEAALTEYLALEAKGWKGGNASAAEQFMRSAVGALSSSQQARIDILRLNEKVIAAAITLVSGAHAWFWKISYDEDFARFSPGVQLALELTEALAKEKSIVLVDSCAVADHPMIDHLWARRIQLADWLVPLSGQASFAAGIVFETARRFSIQTLKAARGLIRQ